MTDQPDDDILDIVQATPNRPDCLLVSGGRPGAVAAPLPHRHWPSAALFRRARFDVVRAPPESVEGAGKRSQLMLSLRSTPRRGRMRVGDRRQAH